MSSQLPSSPCPVRKPSTGCLLCQPTSSCPSCLRPARTYKDNLNSVKEDTYTGNSWSPSPKKLRSAEYGMFSAESTPNERAVTPPARMFSKKKQPFPVRNSSLDAYRSVATSQPTGPWSKHQPKQETWSLYPQMYTFVATINCGVYARTIYAQWEWSEHVMFSGGELALASRETPGQPQVWTVTLKTRTQNFGTVTAIMTMWSSMNFEEELQSITYSDGWIDTHVLWKSRDQVCHCAQETCGSRPI